MLFSGVAQSFHVIPFLGQLWTMMLKI